MEKELDLGGASGPEGLSPSQRQARPSSLRAGGRPGGGIKLRLVLIPSGEFMMGSPSSEKQRGYDESPQHRVKITKPFYMGVYEVTQAQYQQVMGKNPSWFKGTDNPVDCVSWIDAMEFCLLLSSEVGVEVRLPTEAEWEYACRAGTTTPFHTGETISTDQANYDGDYTYGNGRKGVDRRRRTVAVGSFAPNAWGLYDMHGNVWEWCQDWYAEDYYNKSPEEDPQGPATGKYRVLCGGCWFLIPRYCRSASRFKHFPTYSFFFVGFRVVCSPKPPARIAVAG